VVSDVTAPGGLDQPKKPSGECVRLGLGEVIKQETTEATGQEDVSFSLSFPIHPSILAGDPTEIDRFAAASFFPPAGNGAAVPGEPPGDDGRRHHLPMQALRRPPRLRHRHHLQGSDRSTRLLSSLFLLHLTVRTTLLPLLITYM
jgi:hypothetical protein